MNAEKSFMRKAVRDFFNMASWPLEPTAGCARGAQPLTRTRRIIALSFAFAVALGLTEISRAEPRGELSFSKELHAARERAKAFRAERERRRAQEIELNRHAHEISEKRSRDEERREAARQEFVERKRLSPSQDQELERMELENEARRERSREAAERMGLEIALERRLLDEALVRGGGLDLAEELNAYSRRNPYIEVQDEGQ